DPVYWLAGYVKLITAVASVATAIVLPPLVPKTLALVRTAKLSERRRAQLEAANADLSALYAKVKELDDLKTQFSANVAHELRTPVIRLALAPLVLVIEDNAEMSRFIAETLAPAYRVTQAADGHAG